MYKRVFFQKIGYQNIFTPDMAYFDSFSAYNSMYNSLKRNTIENACLQFNILI